MRHLRTEEVQLASIRQGQGFLRRALQPHVLRSIEQVGVLQEPIVRRKRNMWEVITGEAAVAALIHQGAEKVRVKVYELTDDEARRLRLDDYQQRRPLPSAERDQLIMARLLIYVAEEEPAGIYQINKKGRSTPLGRARKRLAKELGMGVESVRNIHWKKSTPEAFDSLGMELSSEFKAKVEKARGYLTAASEGIVKAEKALTLMAHDLGVLFPEEVIRRAREDLYQHSEEMRKLRPVSLCPWCKGLDGVTDNCEACWGSGFITRMQKELGVPEELLDTEEPRVLHEGQVISVKEIAL